MSTEEDDENMAEAVVENRLNTRFFCHECNRFISPNLPEYTCPQCQGGFVEQLNGDESEDDNSISVDSESPDPASEFTELWGRMFLGPSTSDGVESRRLYRFRPVARQRISIRPRMGGEGGAGASNNATAEAAAIDLIIQNLLGIPGMVGREDGPSTSQNIPFPLMLQLHGNPGDYVWGNNGLDSIITQLLNQLEGTGPPPAENDKIESLPTVKVTHHDVEAKVDCAVCQEPLTLDEEVKALPCRHLYHKDCIVPWLQMHDSCPICRLSLSKNPTRCKEGD
ncbi:E3 ubiquitin-protein ligase RNF126-B isoform X2 [Exaiptasia diaphana]|uniref:RING-type E3 ubiquitin transferase n=1 Tax=Exaiptasia diaphana TaxID=2652724 RepID=A0A913XED2_EXADI|nr:E3 ubiquitin-protein ligase RNF126-B isoform X2 [Exaiptasia diaphana]